MLASVSSLNFTCDASGSLLDSAGTALLLSTISCMEISTPSTTAEPGPEPTTEPTAEPTPEPTQEPTTEPIPAPVEGEPVGRDHLLELLPTWGPAYRVSLDLRINSFEHGGAGSASKSSILRFVITEKAPTRAFSWLKGHKVSIVSYSRPSLMIIASRTQFHVERPWGQCPLGCDFVTNPAHCSKIL